MMLEAAAEGMDFVHRYGVYIILWLQRMLKGQGEHMVSITRVGDPDTLIIYVFPLISAINGNLFIRVVLATALVDMLNNVIKWICHGERPYWWVHECENNEDLLSLRQFSLTCETGPGSPSGHAMMTSAVWYIILWAYVKNVVTLSRKKKTLMAIIWTLYLTLFTLVSVSRLYIAAHFPHQVVFGGITGFSVGWLFTKMPVLRFRMKDYLLILLGMGLFAVVTYTGMIALGVDPAWSIHFALKWCERREWIHLSTTPLSSLYRDSGAIIGLACARLFESDVVHLIHRDGREIVTALISFASVQLCACLPLPTEPLWLYYGAVFFKNALISFVAVAMVPKIVKISMNLKEFPITKDSKISELIDLTKRKRKYTVGF